MIKIVLITTDNRIQFKQSELEEPYFGTAPTGLLAGFSELKNVDVHVISCSPEKMNAPEKIAENIWFHQPIIPKIGWGKTLFQGCIRATRKVIREIQPDIVHGQGTERDCALSAVFSDYPNVLTIHGNMARIAEIICAKPFSYYWLIKHLETLAIRRTDGLIAISNHTRRLVENKSRKTWVLPNAVDASFFDVNSPGEGRTALCVAALSPWKRQLELIKALDLLPDEMRPNLVFLGDGANGEYGVKVTSAIAERTWCRHIGAVSREELKKWLKIAGLLILPSIEDNCPMVILEAMAAGVPVAASAIGGIPDLIEDNRTGYLFDPLDENSIRHALTNWKQSPEKTAILAKTAKQEALIRFHPTVIAERHLEIYREVLGR